MQNESRNEVLEYRKRFKDCSPAEILHILGEMHAFFFGRMSPKEIELYLKIRDELNAPASEQDRARFAHLSGRSV